MKILSLLYTISFISILSQASARDFYVSNSGKAGAKGSIEEPLSSIQSAVDLMRAGDTCFIRGGTYHETVNLNNKRGFPKNPITITNYQDEQVTMDGTIKLEAKWTKDKGNIYKTKTPHNVTQLFADDLIMTLARLPNALAFSKAAFTPHIARLEKDPASMKDEVIATAKGIALYQKLWRPLTGCVAVLNFQDHLTRPYVIQKHRPKAKTFKFSPAWIGMKTSKSYFIEGGVGNAERVLLDSEQEWAFDEKTKTLYFWPIAGKHPNELKLRSKTHDHAFTGNADTKCVTIDGINFFATAFHFKSSDGIIIQNCNFNYYSASKRSLGDINGSRTAEFFGSKADFCEDVIVQYNTFRNSDACGLACNHMRNMIINNNLFRNIDYACAASRSTVNVHQSDGLIYRRNTIHTAGKAQAFGSYRYRDGKLNPIVCEYNFHTHCGLLEKDGSSVYIANESVWESVGRYNWFIDNKQRDFRWDGINQPKVLGKHANFYRNVGVGNLMKRVAVGKGFRLKGDHHEVYNNLNIFRHSDLNVSVEKGGNANTITQNNAADVISPLKIPGEDSHNYSAETKGHSAMSKMLRDVKNWDFRPRPGQKGLIDTGTRVTCSVNGEKIYVTDKFNGKAPDIGAYEHGDEFYWIPGYISKQASMPIPKNKSKNTPINTDLIYLQGMKGISSKVYFGESHDKLKLIETLPSIKNIVRPVKGSALKKRTTYYWRVDTILADGTKQTGEIWSFST
ncbi:MAG: hypothetical protein ACSHX6_05525 [Akkermansiaceae bacterium]